MIRKTREDHDEVIMCDRHKRFNPCMLCETEYEFDDEDI